MAGKSGPWTGTSFLQRGPALLLFGLVGGVCGLRKCSNGGRRPVGGGRRTLACPVARLFRRRVDRSPSRYEPGICALPGVSQRGHPPVNRRFTKQSDGAGRAAGRSRQAAARHGFRGILTNVPQRPDVHPPRAGRGRPCEGRAPRARQRSSRTTSRTRTTEAGLFAIRLWTVTTGRMEPAGESRATLTTTRPSGARRRPIRSGRRRRQGVGIR